MMLAASFMKSEQCRCHVRSQINIVTSGMASAFDGE